MLRTFLSVCGWTHKHSRGVNFMCVRRNDAISAADYEPRTITGVVQSQISAG